MLNKFVISVTKLKKIKLKSSKFLGIFVCWLVSIRHCGIVKISADFYFPGNSHTQTHTSPYLNRTCLSRVRQSKY